MTTDQLARLGGDCRRGGRRYRRIAQVTVSGILEIVIQLHDQAGSRSGC